MKQLLGPAIIAAALFAALTTPVYAQSAKPPLRSGEAARPSDTNLNKPSESGAQSSMPSGAATGAGQPQGGAQPPQAEAPGSAKTKSQAKTGSASTQTKSTKHAKKRKHRASKRHKSAANADAGGTSAATQ